MLDSSVFLESSGGGGSASDGAAAEELRNEAAGEDADRSSAGNRWPREETLALLKIRSDMDIAFRDSTLKAPLWDEVSRKLGELGYNRSAKKCKEKFENIYKYHKRTKDGRSSRQNGKAYRFFEQLELLESQLSVPSTPSNHHTMAAAASTPASAAAATKPGDCSQDFPIPCPNNEFTSASTSTASSSGRDSDASIKKKRKLVDYLERLMKDVLDKQEDLQNKFLEALEKCEKDRMAREEAWKAQEMARIKREQEYLAQERAIAAEKDAAVLAFLQKITQQTLPLQMPEILASLFDKRPENQESVAEKRASVQDYGAGEASEKQDNNSAGENVVQMGSSSSRWPKKEVEALIMLKTDLDLQCQDSGPKGPLWEEISTRMKKIGYDRSAKRCKEKWENINKYYKRVKDSNRKRPDDSKTCPYFNMLESLYAKKLKKSQQNGAGSLKPEQILMQMMGQEEQHQQQPEQTIGEYGDNECQNQEEGMNDDIEDDDQVRNSGDGYRVIANNLSSVTTLG